VKILYYSHFYKPETGAAVIRGEYFVRALRNAGHDVLIVTPKPNYPHGKILKEFRSKTVVKNEKENIIYLPIFFVGSHSPFGRLLSYVSYSTISFFYLLFKRYSPDVVLSSSPPIFTSLSAVIYSKVKKSKFIFDIRDIWPDIGIELGILKKGILTKGLSLIEKYILRNSDKIIVTAKGDKENILAKIKDKNKCEVIYNGADTEVFKPISEKEKITIRKKYSIPVDKIVLVYFGSYNHGMNDIETLADFLASERLKRENLFFLSIGQGDNLNFLRNKIKEKINCKFIEALPAKNVAQLVAAADISVIPRKSIVKDTGGNIPVKCFESWAAGLPVLLSNIDGAEISKIFDNCGAGIRVQPDSADALVNGLTELLSKDLSALGKKGRTFVEENFDRKKLSEKLIELLK